MLAQRDTLYVISHAVNGSKDYTPLLTGLLGGVIGIASTYLASRNARNIAKDQIAAQEVLATEQLKQQGEATNRQLRATVVSANRLKWIEELRKQAAAFTSGSMALATDLTGEYEKAAIDGKIDRINDQMSGIALLLNPDEAESRELEETMDATAAALTDLIGKKAEATDVDRIETLVKKVSTVAHKILKNEWVRVKQLT